VKGSAGHEARHKDEACADIFRASLTWPPPKCIGVFPAFMAAIPVGLGL
jgi:hypothetical protein